MHESSLQYVQDLALPEAPPGPRLESARAPDLGSGDQVVAVGAQLTEFGAEVTPTQRSAVADCLLLAQLAANKATSMSSDLMAWYAKYVEVLQNVGWTTQSLEFKDTAVSDTNAGVHKAILPVLTAMLGPGAAATSLVVSVLKGLQEMSTDSPWITLFERSSSHASGAKFQLGSVDTNPAANRIDVKLVKLRTAEGCFGIDPGRLSAVQAAVAERVQPFLLDNISKIEL